MPEAQYLTIQLFGIHEDLGLQVTDKVAEAPDDDPNKEHVQGLLQD